MLTINVAEVPKPFDRPPGPPNGSGRNFGARLRWRAGNPRAFPSRGSINFCVAGRDDRARQTRHLGCAAATRCVDSGWNAALGGDSGSGFDEDSLLCSEAGADGDREMFCDECLAAAAGTDPARLQVSEIEEERARSSANHRNDCGSTGSKSFHPASAASSERSAGNENCSCAACRTRKTEDARRSLHGLRREQADD